jgi:hypothetical protein
MGHHQEFLVSPTTSPVNKCSARGSRVITIAPAKLQLLTIPKEVYSEAYKPETPDDGPFGPKHVSG